MFQPCSCGSVVYFEHVKNYDNMMKKIKTLHINSWNTAHGTIAHTLCILTYLCLQDTLLGMSHTCFTDQKKERVENDNILRDHFHDCAIVHDEALISGKFCETGACKHHPH